MPNQPDSKGKDKLRVYEYAKQQDMTSKEVISILKKVDMPVSNHMSVMEPEMVQKIETFFRSIKQNAAAKKQQADQTNANQHGQESTVIKSTSNQSSQGGSNTPRHSQPRQDQRPSSQGSQGQQRPASSSQGQQRPTSSSQGQQRPSSQGSQGQQRPASSSQGQQGGYRSNNNSQGGGGYNRSNNGTGGQGGPRTGSGPRPGGQSTGGSTGGQGGGYNRSNNGTGGQGGPRTGSGPRPGGQSTGGQGGYNRSNNSGNSNNRPAGTSSSAPTRSFDSRPAPAASASSAPATSSNVNNRNHSKAQHKAKQSGHGGKGYDDNRTGNFRNNHRGGKNKHHRGNQPVQPKEKIDNTPKKIIVRGEMTVGDLAKLLHKDASEVIKKLIMLGVMATINQEVDIDTVQLISSEFGVEVELKIPVEEDAFETIEEVDEEDTLESRPPVVTIMGHVDHGKTTLLDSIRKTSVTLGEAGGITQHIGAYQVEINHKKITFLDTPGHEAFTLMRARGAQVTDITVIVVAADDGVMPQTVEAINHAKAAGVPIIVAVNKIDKEGADPDRIKQELTKYELVPEEWGGDTIFVNLSAKQRIGLEDLLENILLVAEVNDYKANPNKRARGTVIEAELDKGKGPVARILIQHGTLKVGDAFIAGNCFGRVRAMVNDRGRRIKEAGPSTPVEITGLTEVPLAGDPMLVYEDERKARDIAERRAIKQRQTELGAHTRVTLDDLYQHIKDGDIKDLNVIIKADVQGSTEALKGSLAKIDIEGVRVKIIHSGVGAISESDINLASASNAIVIGFNVRPEPQALATAEQEQVDIRMHNIIYNVIDEIEHAMKGMLDPVYKEVVIGQAEVRNLFKVSKVGTIAGCMITSGKITRNAKARLIRGGIVVFEGAIESLKRFKDDAKEVSQGYECGITLERYNELKEGDIIEAYILETVER